jgi:hypothetical protein
MTLDFEKVRVQKLEILVTKGFPVERKEEFAWV